MVEKTPPTIYDVARLAGVSIATVSRVINAPQKVNEETRNSIMAAIQSLGFVPKAEARARALRGSRRIGVITPFFTAPAFVQRLRGIATELTSENYELVVYATESIKNLRSQLDSLLINPYLDGLIIISMYLDDDHVTKLINNNLETVLIEFASKDLTGVLIDDVAGGKMAAEYLYAKGYRHLGFVGDSEESRFGIHPITSRLSGFSSALAGKGVELSERDTMLVPYDFDLTRHQALAFLSRADRPRAIFAATDLQAIAVMSAARKLGLRIPQDLAVLGFDGLDISEYVGLSTISQSLDESGKVAAELLLALIADNSRLVQHVKLPLKIIERETT